MSVAVFGVARYDTDTPCPDEALTRPQGEWTEAQVNSFDTAYWEWEDRFW